MALNLNSSIGYLASTENTCFDHKASRDADLNAI